MGAHTFLGGNLFFFCQQGNTCYMYTQGPNFPHKVPVQCTCISFQSIFFSFLKGNYQCCNEIKYFRKLLVKHLATATKTMTNTDWYKWSTCTCTCIKRPFILQTAKHNPLANNPKSFEVLIWLAHDPLTDGHQRGKIRNVDPSGMRHPLKKKSLPLSWARVLLLKTVTYGQDFSIDSYTSYIPPPPPLSTDVRLLWTKRLAIFQELSVLDFND